MPIQTETHKKVRDALLIAGCMDSNSSLRAMFVDTRLALWRSQVPEANSKGERVNITIAKFMDQFNSSQQNILAVLLEVIGQREAGMLATTLLELSQQVQYETTGVKMNAFNQSGQNVKYQVNTVPGATVGAVGDNAVIPGGIHFGKKEQEPMYNTTQSFDVAATQLAHIRQAIALRKEFGLKVSDELLAEGRKIRAEVEAAAAAEKQNYAESVKRQLREVETAEEKRARLKKELEELDDSPSEI